jgi:hypothetical protein
MLPITAPEQHDRASVTALLDKRRRQRPTLGFGDQQISHKVGWRIGVVQSGLSDHRPELDLPGNSTTLSLRMSLGSFIEMNIDSN